MRRSLTLLLLTTVIGVMAVGRGTGAPPRIEADLSKDYFVFPQVGDWMVLAAYYTGPERAALARQMAYKIRAQYSLPAYVFVYVDEERKRQKEEYERVNDMARKLMLESGAAPVKLKLKTIRLEEQYGVLIGGWADPESANKALVAIRKLQAPHLDSTMQAATTEMEWTMSKDDKGEWKRVLKEVNPFEKAIVTRNPSIKQEHAVQKADPALKKFNAEEEYSLLKCPQKYTLLVKEYTGTSSLQDERAGKDTGFLAALGLGGNKEGEAISVAGAQAHETARVLRQLNFDAYVLHTRSSSAVTIGGFAGPNDPSIQRVAQQLEQVRQRMTAQVKSGALQLLPTPLVVEVPRP